MADNKLDIFRVLEQIDRRNYDFFDTLNDEEKKAFVPFIVARWMSGATDQGGLHGYYLTVTNEMVNKDLWSLTKHPELLWKLMACCGAGQKKRHQWIKGPTRKSASKINKVLKEHFMFANEKELDLIKREMGTDGFKQFLIDLAYPEKEEKELVKQFKKEMKNG